MFIYIFLLITLISLHMLNNKIDRKKTKIIMIFIILFLIVIQGLRSFSVGVDLFNYERIFNQYSVESLKWDGFGSEYLYRLLNNFIFKLGGNFRIVLFLVAILTYVPLGYISYTYSEKPFLSILMFVLLGFFVFTLSGLRQSIAIGITLLSYKQIRKKNIIKFLILVAIATGFHKSALFFVIAYPIYNISIKKRNFIFVFLALLVIFIFKKPVFDQFYQFYNGGYDPIETGAYNFLIMLLAFYVISIIIFWKSVSKEISGLMNLLLIAIIIQIFASYSTIVMRIGYYYYVYLILLIPKQVVQLKDTGFRVAYQFIVILFLGTIFLTSIKDNILKIYPYKFLTVQHNDSIELSNLLIEYKNI